MPRACRLSRSCSTPARHGSAWRISHAPAAERCGGDQMTSQPGPSARTPSAVIASLVALAGWWWATSVWITDHVGYLDLDMAGPAPVVWPALSVAVVTALALVRPGRHGLLAVAVIGLAGLWVLAAASLAVGLGDGQVSATGYLLAGASVIQLGVLSVWLVLTLRDR